MPEKGVNAVYKAARAVTALQEFDFNVARHDVLGLPTINVGTIQGGLNINSVPDRATIGIDIRTIPAQRHAQIREQLTSYLGRDVTLRTLLNAKSVWTDPHHPWISEVFQVARNVEGIDNDIGAAPYFTDASALTPAFGSPPTVIIGPGELALAHQTDEYCQVSRIERATEMYTQLVRNWCRI
jgi:succinyl-diaminopimelate desuccinylase